MSEPATSLRDLYEYKIGTGEITRDPVQEHAVYALDRLRIRLTKTSLWPFGKRQDTQGLYIYGGVGRGKSMLMDMFYALVPLTKKRRVHFHEFMIETHDYLHNARSRNEDNILPQYAREVAKKTKLLCFDEFHVTDITNAMILSRLFTALFEAGITVVTTSNWAPDDLYKDGLQRSSFLPFIALIKRKMDVLHLNSPTDYRSEALIHTEKVFFPVNAAQKQKFEALYDELTAGKQESVRILDVKGRQIRVHCGGDVARFTFAELCEKPLGAEDYIHIAQSFSTVFIEGVPVMKYDRRNELKRFILLIDALYEAKCHLIILAEASLETLCQNHDHAFEFDRTLSRLQEMQSDEYLK